MTDLEEVPNDSLDNSGAEPQPTLTVAVFSGLRLVFVESVLAAVARKGAGYFNETVIDSAELGRRVLAAVGNTPLVARRGADFARSVSYLLSYYGGNPNHSED